MRNFYMVEGEDVPGLLDEGEGKERRLPAAICELAPDRFSREGVQSGTGKDNVGFKLPVEAARVSAKLSGLLCRSSILRPVCW